MELISKATRIAFREHLVGWTLATIADLFDAEDIARADIPPERTPNGARRGLVEEYYASIDWTLTSDVRKVLRAYERVLEALDSGDHHHWLPAEERKRQCQKLLNLLKRDGITYHEGRLLGQQKVDLSRIRRATKLLDTAAIHEHVCRIEAGIDGDPALAIGSAKELLETTAKQILEASGLSHDFDSLQQLVKEAMKTLNLSLESIPEQSKGASSLKQVISGLNQIVGATAELRNLYGTGHGRTRPGGLRPRHARLVVGAAATLCVFLLETFDERRTALLSVKPSVV